MGLIIRQVNSKKDRKIFVKLQYQLHNDHDLWVPPLLIFEKNYLNPKKNYHLAYSNTILLLAYKDNKPIGRIMGIINNKLNETWNTKQARFCNFDSINDQKVANELLRNIEEWAKEHKMKHLVGPLGFSNQDPQGFLIEGFKERPSIRTNYNYDYIPKLIENAGYTKEIDYVTYKVPIPEKIPLVYEKISERIAKRGSIQLLEFNSKKEAKAYLPKVLRFMNETYTGIYGFIPLTEDIIKKTSHTYAEILDPHFLKVIVDNDEIVAFIFGIRDITDGFKKAGGNLIPFGYFKIKFTQKKANRLDLLLGAIKEGYRGKGPFDVEKLVDVIVKVSKFFHEKEEILEFDLNPTFVLPKGKGVKIVDVRVILKSD